MCRLCILFGNDLHGSPIQAMDSGCPERLRLLYFNAHQALWAFSGFTELGLLAPG